MVVLSQFFNSAVISFSIQTFPCQCGEYIIGIKPLSLIRGTLIKGIEAL